MNDERRRAAAFFAACARGDIEAAQTLARYGGLTAADARAYDNQALRWACAGGHLGVAADEFVFDKFVSGWPRHLA